MGWLILFGYFVVVVLSWRRFTMDVLESFERECPSVGLDDSDRFESATFGTILALLWPIALPVRIAWRQIMSKDMLRTSKEIQAAQQAELEAYRKLAQEHGLPTID